MRVFRLSKSAFAQDLSGKGAELAGGRWNSKGIPVLYTSESRALCLAEVAVHIPAGIIPKDYQIVEIEIPDKGVFILNETELPFGWNGFPAIKETERIGNEWIRKNEFLTLRVPSAVVEGEFNYLINPKHTDSGKVKIVTIKPFRFDSRLFKM